MKPNGSSLVYQSRSLSRCSEVIETSDRSSTSSSLLELGIRAGHEVNNLFGWMASVELFDDVDLVFWNLFINDNSVPSESFAQFA